MYCYNFGTVVFSPSIHRTSFRLSPITV